MCGFLSRFFCCRCCKKRVTPLFSITIDPNLPVTLSPVFPQTPRTQTLQENKSRIIQERGFTSEQLVLLGGAGNFNPSHRAVANTRESIDREAKQMASQQIIVEDLECIGLGGISL